MTKTIGEIYKKLTDLECELREFFKDEKNAAEKWPRQDTFISDQYLTQTKDDENDITISQLEEMLREAKEYNATHVSIYQESYSGCNDFRCYQFSCVATQPETDEIYRARIENEIEKHIKSEKHKLEVKLSEELKEYETFIRLQNKFSK